MFSLTIVSPTYQAIDSAPMRIVETCGVRYRGWMRPSDSGIALARAIDSDVRAVGRIVVCVDAAADVSTAMITILPSRSRAEHVVGQQAEHVVGLVVGEPVGPAEGHRRGRDDHVDAEQDQRRGDRGRPGIVSESSVSSLTVTRLSQPQ